MQNFKDLWNMAIENCRKHVSVVSYNTWLQYMTPISFDGATFTVSVPTEMYRDVISQNYLPILMKIFQETIGIEPIVTFICENDKTAAAVEEDEPVDILSTYTFANYVVGESNSFAFAAARSVAEKYPITSYNPLVLYGQSGVGKTHLALAIYNYIKAKFPEKKLEYIRSEQFTNDVISGIHNNNMAEIRDRLRTVDVLLIDDIHFIAGKTSVQEEFFNTFNALFQANKQIIVTCDRPINEIKTLEDRIKSRLFAGLTCDIQLPDFETRVGIIRRNLNENNLHLNDETVYYIAEQINQNARQLEGAIKKLSAISQFDNDGITRSVVAGVIRDIKIGQLPEPVSPTKIIEEVARTYQTDSETVLSKKQSAVVAKCRHISMYIIREVTNLPLEEIGAFFGKDHSTVHYSINKVKNLMEQNQKERATIEDIINNLKP